MSNTKRNIHTLSQSTPSLYHIPSTHNKLSRTHLPTDNGMEETKVGESEGKEANGLSDEWRQAATEVRREEWALMLERWREGGKEGRSDGTSKRRS